MMVSKVKEKLELLQKDEIKCRELIKNFRKTLNIWFIYGEDDSTILSEVINSCVEIILHGLKNEPEKIQTKTTLNTLDYDSSPTTSTASANINYNSNNNGSSDLNLSELHKVIDDFEWVRNAVSIRRNLAKAPPQNVLPAIGGTSATLLSLHNHYFAMQIQRQSSQSTVASQVSQWLNNNLNDNNLCRFMQYLVNDKELLEEHYYEEALLRQKKYVTILVIGLTAFETRQYGLLSQIDLELHDDIKNAKHQKRSNSQPNVILIPNKKFNISSNANTSTFHYHSALNLTTFRKTKSLPEFINKSTDAGCLKRTRCKTISTIKHRTIPHYIPQKITQSVNCNANSSDSQVVTSSSGSFLNDYDDNLPSTSQTSSNRSKSPLSNYTLNSNNSATSSLMSTSVSSYNSNNTIKCIQLINTDNIKIWTDHSWELKQKSKQQNQQQQPAASCAIPTPLVSTTKTNKSPSSFTNFFSSLFSTPPSYTSWFIEHEKHTKHETTETAIESIISDNNEFQNRQAAITSQQQSSSLSMGSTVFDKFLPTDGKKLRSRKSQNLFDDINTTLVSVGKLSEESPSSSYLSPDTSKNCQSLTRFLQMSHLSRNNTDLEKENAHFRISEAIISAIEHIKWSKLETHKDKFCCEATHLATDCLASPDHLKTSSVLPPSTDLIEGEHMPYAELEEVSYDQLSAEVVGLSLISKFDEKQLPKVSELKWLVSDDDTPQKLLPMPDLTGSANPDDHVIHSATRGTRYWAPPRQQIIFTDHPAPNRKELLKKQNNRCTGCGMRVSPEYIQSFRYCTYLGKYHCTGCHRNQISATPAKILQSWDFKCYPVSVFAYRLLEQMYAYPLFYVPDLNPALYIRCKSLLSARNKRLQLKYVKDFIRTCRFALREQSYFESVPNYITADIDNWSMSDFIDARTECLQRSVDELINKCENHIFNCVLCTARGFLCEYCRVDVVIYPWNSRVERCDRCGTCFHRSCWKSMSEKCCRCQRIDKRQDEINDVI